MKKVLNYLFSVFTFVLLPTAFSFAQVNPDCSNGVEILDYTPLDGSTDAVADINAAGLTLAGSALTVTNTFNGSAIGDEDTVNDDHLTGCVGPKLGVRGSLNSADNMTTTYSFSDPLDDFCFRLVDIDRNDEVIVNGSLSGVPYTLTAANFTYPYTGADGPCPDYLGGNTFTSLCVPPEPSLNNTLRSAVEICFPEPIDEIEFTFYDKGTTDGGSYTVCDMGVCLDPLPIALAGFWAQERDCEVALNWNTNTETDFSHFEVQKSSNGSDYTTIATINSRGNNATGATYNFTDEQLTENNYYRLKMVDNDGLVEYSEMRIISSDCAEVISISDVYPNPIRGDRSKVRFTGTTNDDNANIVIRDVLSRVVAQQSVQVNEGTNVIDLETTHLNVGTYYLMLQGDNWQTGVVRFTKQ